MTIKTGRFVWFDYVGKDVEKAKAFYGELFHWKTKDVPVPGAGAYTMITANDQTIGGYMAQPPGAPAQGHWLSALQVADAAATCAQIKQLGGKVRKEPFKIGEFGTMAIVADPFEATFTLWQPANPEGTGDYREQEHTWCWNELTSPDPDKAIAFYKAIGGFDVRAMDMGPGGTYYTFESDGKGRGGMMKQAPGQPVQWMPYVHVASADQTHERAKKLGATVHVPPADIPNIGRFAVFSDPTGAAIAVLQPARKS